MSAARCRVSFTDTDGIPHDVQIQAETLYEAVALALVEFQMDAHTPNPGPLTEFTVAIQRPVIEHRIRLNQVAKWADTDTTREGPAGIAKRQKVKDLLSKARI